MPPIEFTTNAEVLINVVTINTEFSMSADVKSQDCSQESSLSLTHTHKQAQETIKLITI